MGARGGNNKGKFTRKNICPTCRVEFMGPIVKAPGGGPLSRQCPNGHWHSLYDLGRVVTAEGVARAANDLAGMRFRKLGVSSNHEESLTLGILAMVGAYERVRDQFPAGSQARALLEGAFAVPAKVARELVA